MFMYAFYCTTTPSAFHRSQSPSQEEHPGTQDSIHETAAVQLIKTADALLFIHTTRIVGAITQLRCCVRCCHSNSIS